MTDGVFSLDVQQSQANDERDGSGTMTPQMTWGTETVANGRGN